jgi:hypothetical protein
VWNIASTSRRAGDYGIRTTDELEIAMKTFLAIYTGTQEAHERSGWNDLGEAERKAREAKGLEAWMQWGKDHADAIVAQGGPLGKTKRVAKGGFSDTTNNMTGYVVVRAESHGDAAKLFENHPHFTIFPGEGVEIMECLPMPSR